MKGQGTSTSLFACLVYPQSSLFEVGTTRQNWGHICNIGLWKSPYFYRTRWEGTSTRRIERRRGEPQSNLPLRPGPITLWLQCSGELNYQGIWPPVSRNLPVGPSFPIRAARIVSAEPSSIV